jgi:hypothetical protein
MTRHGGDNLGRESPTASPPGTYRYDPNDPTPSVGTSRRTRGKGRAIVDNRSSRVMPVRLPPGRLRLATSPAFRGSSMNPTIGIVLVAAAKIVTTGLVPVTIKSGLRLTISRAKSAYRS